MHKKSATSALLQISIKNKTNRIGIIANGKYFLFLEKLTAFPKGIGCNELAFWSIEAKSNSDLLVS